MVLSEIQAEVAARGFDFDGTTRLTQWINDAYLLDICEVADWPFLEATSTGVAPRTITDLANIESVIDSTQKLKLHPLDRRNITDDDSDLTTVGSPQFYYVTAGTTVNVYPANTTNSLSVRYWKVPTALSAAGDTPLLPARFHRLIVDAAVVYAYEDNDEYAAAQTAWAQFQQRLNVMKETLLILQHDEPDDMVVSYAPDADLVG